MTTEERLIRLEEQNFFQEEQLRQLNEALISQQNQLDTVERELARATELLRSMRNKMSEEPQNSLPPHYMPERY